MDNEIGTGMIGGVVVLSALEQRLCRHVAEARNEANRQAQVTNAKVGDRSDVEVNFEGVSGEVAFCRLFNIYPDLTVQPRSSRRGTDTGDARLPSGHTVDESGRAACRGRG